MGFLERFNFILHEQPAVTLKLNRQTLSDCLFNWTQYIILDIKKLIFMLSHDPRIEISIMS